MKARRGIVISFERKPEHWDDYEVGIWMQAKDFPNVSECIKAAMRMRPDELVIKQECFGTFKVA